MIWWILGIGALLAVSKASQSSSVPQPTIGPPIGPTSPPGLAPSPIRPAIRFPGAIYQGSPDIKEIGPFMFNEGPPLPGPAVNAPQASTTLTDYQTNLASAFNAYANVYLNKQVSAGAPVPAGVPGSAGPGGGSNYFGSGGTGGGHGSIGCPVVGTEIITLGGGPYQSSEFISDEWIEIRAGEFKLTATPTHELITMKGKIRLSEVSVGDLVITKEGERRVSTLLTHHTSGINAMRIHVPISHMYFADGILSHNKA